MQIKRNPHPKKRRRHPQNDADASPPRSQTVLGMADSEVLKEEKTEPKGYQTDIPMRSASVPPLVMDPERDLTKPPQQMKPLVPIDLQVSRFHLT